jgi:hypothetical protein
MEDLLEHLGFDVIDLDGLEEFPGNPKRHDIPALRESLRQFGQFESVIVRVTDDGRRVLLKGHGITEAMREEGWENARCELIACTSDDEARRIMLGANRFQELAGYADDLLAEQILALEDGLYATGFDETYVEQLLLRTDTMADSASAFLTEPDAPGPGAGEVGDGSGPPPAPTDGYVLISWLVPVEDRDMIREVVAKVKAEGGHGTGAEAVVALFRSHAPQEVNA